MSNSRPFNTGGAWALWILDIDTEDQDNFHVLDIYIIIIMINKCHCLHYKERVYFANKSMTCDYIKVIIIIMAPHCLASTETRNWKDENRHTQRNFISSHAIYVRGNFLCAWHACNLLSKVIELEVTPRSYPRHIRMQS